jgi:putative membrane protein
MTDGLLSALHFVLMEASSLRLAARLDRAYGASAVLLLGVGFGRVFYGAKGAQFYLANPMFWVKIGLFAAVALLSIPPTVQLIRWTRQARLDTTVLPADEQLSRMRRWVVAEAGVLLLLPFAAAAMARGYGL